MRTISPTKLGIKYDARDAFDRALLAVSESANHSRCYFGNKAKVAVAESGDERWARHAVKFMPERGEVRFTYGGHRFAQDLTPSEVRWLDRFDIGQAVQSKTITLDPSGLRTRSLGPVIHRPKPQGYVAPAGRTGCLNHNTPNNSGRAKRLREMVNGRSRQAVSNSKG